MNKKKLQIFHMNGEWFVYDIDDDHHEYIFDTFDDVIRWVKNVYEAKTI